MRTRRGCARLFRLSLVSTWSVPGCRVLLGCASTSFAFVSSILQRYLCKEIFARNSLQLGRADASRTNGTARSALEQRKQPVGDELAHRERRLGALDAVDREDLAVDAEQVVRVAAH